MHLVGNHLQVYWLWYAFTNVVKSSSGIELIQDTKARLSNLTLDSTLIDQIKVVQASDVEFVRIKGEVAEGKRSNFTVSNDGTLRFKKRLCVPNNREIRNQFYENLIVLCTLLTQVVLRYIRIWNNTSDRMEWSEK